MIPSTSYEKSLCISRAAGVVRKRGAANTFPSILTHIGRGNFSIKDSKGFTLLELIVVITLLSIMLMFAIPRFHSSTLSNGPEKASRWIIANVQALKIKAWRERKYYILEANIDSGEFTITEETLVEQNEDEAEPEVKKAKGYTLPEGTTIADVEFPGMDKLSSGVARIHFYPKGYSDKALIHLKTDEGDRLTFLIEPFLPRVELFKEYTGF